MADAVVCGHGAKRATPRANSEFVNSEVSDVLSGRIANRYCLANGKCWHGARSGLTFNDEPRRLAAWIATAAATAVGSGLNRC